MEWLLAAAVVLGFLIMMRLDVLRARLDQLIELLTPEDRLEVLGFTYSEDEAWTMADEEGVEIEET